MKNKQIRKSQDSDDDGSQASVEVDTDNSPKCIPIAKLPDKLRTRKIVINISDTQYPIVEEVAEELGWVIQKQPGPGDWDVWWTDREIDSHTFFRVHMFQKINHFPGIYMIARKNLFGLGLMAMRQSFPDEYNFFPQTWTIPLQFSQFRHHYQSASKATYIVKPQALSQGRGIFLTRNIQDVLNGNKYVIQNYITNPMLIDKLKFDLRIYVLMAGTDPLRLYIYHQGLTRFATEQYRQPTNDNLNRNYVHLTNYSLNKNNPKYIYNSSEKDMDKGHKRTLSSTYERLAKNGIDVESLKRKIEDAIIKSVISGLPTIKHQYQYCQPEEYQGNMCFHILGFDVMLTDDCQPIVIEVNHTPSFETGTPLDYLVKKNLIKDTLKLMRITQKNKRKGFERTKEIAKIRLQTGRRDIFKGKEREEAIKKARQSRDEAEKDIMGGYKKIFPPQDPEAEAKYNKFYDAALKISRSDADVRKKLLKDEQKAEQKKAKSDKSKRLIKKAVSKEEQPLNQTTVGQKECKSQKEIKTGKSMTKQTSLPQIDTLNFTINQQNEEEIPIDSLELQVMAQKARASLKHQGVKGAFRTKINKKVQGSNQQLVKYTESIKRFNDLMVKYIAGKDPSAETGIESTQYKDSEAFQNLREKINKNGQISSCSGYPIIYRESKPLALTPGKGVSSIVPVGQSVASNCLKMELKNGSFIKPKSYLISDYRQSQTMKMHLNKKWSGDEQVDMKEVMIGQIEPNLSKIIAESRPSKAFSKLLAPTVHKGLSLRR